MPYIRSEEHTSELQSHDNLVCRLLLEKNSRETAPSHAPAAGLPRHHFTRGIPPLLTPGRAATCHLGHSGHGAPGGRRSAFFFKCPAAPAPPPLPPPPLLRA